MKIAPTQLSEKEFSSLKNDINKTLRDIRNGIVHAQGRENTRHGKAGEIAVCKLLNFRNQDGTLYEQNGMGCDVPKSVVERSNLPKELHCDVEVKYYETKSGSLLGDASKKIKKLKKGLVLIKAFYDKTPNNPLPQIHIEKIVPNAEDLKAFERMEKIVAFVKDKSNPIKGFGGTREKVKQENKKFKTTRFFLNNNSNTKTNGRQIQLVDRWS
jgi:hypothetical protein